MVARETRLDQRVSSQGYYMPRLTTQIAAGSLAQKTMRKK
jgi:hypothetical protein